MINQKVGLEYCGNMPSLYMGLLNNFYEQYHNSIDILENSSWEDKKLLIHSVKGISLNLGSVPLYEISLKQDSLIKKEDNILDEYKDLFRNVLKSIKEILEI